MNCSSARDAFPELLDRRTPATAHLEARAHLAACPDCQREFSAVSQTLTALDAMPAPTPSPRLRQNFYAMLEEEKHSAASVLVAAERERRMHRTSLLGWIVAPLAAAAMLALGFFLGARRTDDVTVQKIAALEKKMGQMTQLVGYQLIQQQQGTVNARLQEVLVAAKADRPSDKVLDDLVTALAFDPSVNVRLRALEALYGHADRKIVRDGVLAALPREQNPLVQLELIDFVAAAHDANATPILETLAQNEQIEQGVRDAARTALAQL